MKNILFLGGILSAQVCNAVLLAQVPVVVVDDQAGPGVNYTALADALLGAPEGAVLLLKGGTYTLPMDAPFFGEFPIELDGKSLHIVGDSNALVKVTGPLYIKNLSSPQRFSWINIDEMAGSYRFNQCAGRAWVERAHGSAGGFGNYFVILWLTIVQEG